MFPGVFAQIRYSFVFTKRLDELVGKLREFTCPDFMDGHAEFYLLAGQRLIPVVIRIIFMRKRRFTVCRETLEAV